MYIYISLLFIYRNTGTSEYTCQLTCLRRESRLRIENYDLMLTHAYGPYSQGWLKNVSFARHNFQTT